MEELRYPVGRFRPPSGPLKQEERQEFIQQLASTPEEMRRAINDLAEDQLDTPYRPGGWSVRQVVHHTADSHLNAYVRIRLALTEEEPLIKTYEQDEWARLGDASSAPVEPSLALLDALHQRLEILLRSLSAEQFQRKLKHPDFGTITVDTLLALYAWDGRHHVGHVKLVTRSK